MRQLPFLPKNPLTYGGDVRKGKRKLARPIDPKHPIHLTLRSARRDVSMLHPRNIRVIESCVREKAKKHGVRVYRFANVGNHLHLLIKAPSRRGFQAFLREAAGRIAMLMTRSCKGNPGRYWEKLAWSRIVQWGQDFQELALYLIKNLLEAQGARVQGRRVVCVELDRPPPAMN